MNRTGAQRRTTAPPVFRGAVLSRARWRARRPRHTRDAGSACLALCALLLLLAPVARGQSEASFDEAKVLYEQGQYAGAATAFDRLYTNGVSSVALHFNLGNAWLKAGETGRAIAHYRFAQRLAPRDPDVRANLQLARSVAIGDESPRQPLLRRLFGWLSLDEWTRAATGAFWIWVGAIVIGLLRPDARHRLRRWRQIGLGLTALLAICLAFAWVTRPSLEAVVVDADTPLLHSPREESEVVQALKSGQELLVRERRGGWARVEGAPRGSGWVQTRHLVLLPR